MICKLLKSVINYRFAQSPNLGNLGFKTNFCSQPISRWLPQPTDHIKQTKQK